MMNKLLSASVQPAHLWLYWLDTKPDQTVQLQKLKLIAKTNCHTEPQSITSE